jgi:hypothetical protein
MKFEERERRAKSRLVRTLFRIAVVRCSQVVPPCLHVSEHCIHVTEAPVYCTRRVISSRLSIHYSEQFLWFAFLSNGVKHVPELFAFRLDM